MILSENRKKEIKEILGKIKMKEEDDLAEYLKRNLSFLRKHLYNADLLKSKQLEILKNTVEHLKNNETKECRENLQKLIKMWELVDESQWLFERDELEAI